MGKCPVPLPVSVKWSSVDAGHAAVTGLDMKRRGSIRTSLLCLVKTCWIASFAPVLLSISWNCALAWELHLASWSHAAASCDPIASWGSFGNGGAFAMQVFRFLVHLGYDRSWERSMHWNIMLYSGATRSGISWNPGLLTVLCEMRPTYSEQCSSPSY